MKTMSDCRSTNHNQNRQSTKTSDTETRSGKYDSNEQLNTNPYILIIGPAGAGKTTLSKRVVLTTFKNKRFAFLLH